MTTKAFPREVVYSPEYGSGIASSNKLGDGREYDLIEDPITVDCAKRSLSSDVLVDRLVASGRWTIEELKNVYWGGWRNAEVTTVNGPYLIDEYDGYESIVEADQMEWRV